MGGGNPLKSLETGAKQAFETVVDLFDSPPGFLSPGNGDTKDTKDTTTVDTPLPSVSPSSLSEMTALKKMRAMRKGLLSTIRTSPMGITSSPSLLSPSATGTTKNKTLLG